ncbi:MAG: FAD-binding protein, partial [Rhodanobacteraceae bacterium]
MKNRLTLIRWLIIIALLGGVLAFFAFGLQHQLSLEALKIRQQELEAYRQAHPWLLGAGFFLTYVIFAALSLPSAEILTIAAGAIFGLLEGTLLVSFASTIGATLAMLSSRFILRDWIRTRLGARLQRVDEGIRREGGFYLFSIRMVPIFPFFAVNLALGLTSLPTFTFYWVSQLGMLAGTVVYANAGTQLAGLQSPSGLLSPGLIGSFLLLALLPWIGRAILGWMKRRRLYRAWKKPKRYDRNLVVIGAGSAGLVSAYIAATAKAKVTLIEKHQMGGDCLNTGCVPSKS